MVVQPSAVDTAVADATSSWGCGTDVPGVSRRDGSGGYHSQLGLQRNEDLDRSKTQDLDRSKEYDVDIVTKFVIEFTVKGNVVLT